MTYHFVLNSCQNNNSISCDDATLLFGFLLNISRPGALFWLSFSIPLLRPTALYYLKQKKSRAEKVASQNTCRKQIVAIIFEILCPLHLCFFTKKCFSKTKFDNIKTMHLICFSRQLVLVPFLVKGVNRNSVFLRSCDFLLLFSFIYDIISLYI